MILFLGTDAYSPFRMDAIKDTINKLAPELGGCQIDARWVYAIETAGAEVDAEIAILPLAISL